MATIQIMEHGKMMDAAAAMLAGAIDPDDFLALLDEQRSAELAGSQLDLDRHRRCGYPEVIFGQGKSLEDLVQAADRLVAENSTVLVTRLADGAGEVLRQHFAKKSGAKQSESKSHFNEMARTFRWGQVGHEPCGSVAVVSAGTSDAPVAAEAHETLLWMNVNAFVIPDVGVAGPHRLPQHVEKLRAADAVIVVAGMEGALPSVVGGYVACPVFAVPTSVGYGASFGGVSALLGMLNSCASNVAVVNIDAGFKAAYLSGMVAQRLAAARNSGQEPASIDGGTKAGETL